MTRGRVTTGAAGLAFVSLVRCGTVLGLDDYRSANKAPVDASSGQRDGTPEPACGGVRYRTTSCQKCLDDGCCVETKACNDEPMCRFLLQCLIQCEDGDEACRGRCNLNTPYANTAVVNTLLMCSAACPGCGVAPLQWGGPVCNPCMQQRCKKEIDAYATNETALAYGSCLCFAGSLDPCPCTVDNAAGKPVLDAVNNCMKGGCDAECSQPAWSCVDTVQWPKPDPRTTEMEFTVLLADLPCSNGLANMHVRACLPIDSNCDTVLAEGTTNDSGFATLTLLASGQVPGFGEPFRGYLLITPPDTTYREQIYYPMPPPRESTKTGQCMATRALWDAGVQQVGVQPDSNSGAIFFGVRDCGGGFASGVVVETDPPARVYYMGPNRAPAPELTETSSASTGAIGMAPGRVTLTARFGDGGAPFAKTDVIVRADTVTTIVLFPTPAE